jgi:hypothetical protein
MKAAQVIEEIRHLDPSEQAEVINFAIGLARRRQLSAEELGEMAEKFANSNDPVEIARLRSAMTRGFYGFQSMSATVAPAGINGSTCSV